MTDLEDLWDDVPVSPAPVDRILRAGRALGASGPVARSRRRGRMGWLRPLGSVGALAALGGAFVVGAHVGSPAGPPGVPPGSEAAPGGTSGSEGSEASGFGGELVAAPSCEALLAHYVERAADLVGPYGWGYGYGLLEEQSMRRFATRDAAVTPLSSAYAAQAPMSQSTAASGTGTNVQESAVDEPDVVKTDGTTLWRIDGDVLTASDVSGETVEELSSTDLGEVAGVGTIGDVELLLAGDTLVALGSTNDTRGQSTSSVVALDVADPSAPRVEHVREVEAGLVTARQHGTTVRVVTAAGLPDLDFVRPQPRVGISAQEAIASNRRLIEQTTIDDWLPTSRLDGADGERLGDCESVAIPRDELGLDTVSVLGFDAADPDGLVAPEVTTLAASTTIAYASADHLYLAASPATWGGCLDFCSFSSRRTTPATSAGTHVFDFELDGTGTRYVGAGEVDGVVEDRWAMDEHDGVLRLAVGPNGFGREMARGNAVVTLERDGDRLVETGRLDGLGVGETIQSVRWFDGLAIVVTFRQIDPLYTVDLTDPAAPTLLGELKIPGFSSYLHPLGSRRILGIGEGPAANGRGWGAQAGLFKVRDLTDPRRLATAEFGSRSYAHAGDDPRQFTWLPDRRTALTVISRGRQGWVAVLTVADGELGNRLVDLDLAPGAIQGARTVPLPDGRVVLSTPGTASFLAL